jgi:hypothetical protein
MRRVSTPPEASAGTLTLCKLTGQGTRENNMNYKALARRFWERGYVNRLIYTSDISADVGGRILVVPGSHLRGELTPGATDEDFPDQLVLSPSRGTLILLHGHTWHRVTRVNGKCRVSTNYRSIPRGTPQDITDICVYRNMRYKFETSEVVEDRLQV